MTKLRHHETCIGGEKGPCNCGVEEANRKLAAAERPGEIIDVLFSHWINEFGLIRVEIWPEGLVVWVGGQIRYKSWEGAVPRHITAL